MMSDASKSIETVPWNFSDRKRSGFRKVYDFANSIIDIDSNRYDEFLCRDTSAEGLEDNVATSDGVDMDLLAFFATDGARVRSTSRIWSTSRVCSSS
jgi:hypothetical protein